MAASQELDANVMPKKPAAPGHIRAGGIAHGKRDPLRHAPLREPYAARSGATPEEQGTPDTVAKNKPRKRGGQSKRA